ncbi:hypothetical protein PSTT_12743 [Puccinia striiformis]|uniref:Uncharacterized protein n=1 Tax=Puccinia striiformis TaxID=27350 RepID=A0A2S4UUT8_9BASI|nr:hypothetical protein PSTT_12743 [Puccinia striiformis]
MQDSNVFFLGTQDSLGFVSNFSGNSGPYLCCVPNGGPLELNRVRADGGKALTGQGDLLQLTSHLDVVWVSKIGTITSVRYFYGVNQEPYCKMMVDHEHWVSLNKKNLGRGAAVQVYYVISVDGLDVLPNTLFRLGSQI